MCGFNKYILHQQQSSNTVSPSDLAQAKQATAAEPGVIHPSVVNVTSTFEF